MKPCLRAAVLLLSIGVSLFAQAPLIYTRSIYNAASLMPAGIPGGAVARGSIFTFTGARMGPTTPASATTFPLQTTLGGVSVSVIQGATTVAAIPIYVSQTQIQAIMPSNAPVGMASVQVAFNGVKSNRAPVRIAANGFGIYTQLGTGFGPGQLQNNDPDNGPSVNTPANPAVPGQTISLSGTGLGPVAADNIAPAPGVPTTKTEVFVGGVSAPIVSSGRDACCAGKDQVVFTVPPDAPLGCWVPVYVRTDGQNVSNVVTMAIASPDTMVCSTDVFPQMTGVFISGGTAGAAGVARVTTHHDVGTTAAVDVTAEYSMYFAATAAAPDVPFHPVLSFPPSGSCTAFTLQGDMLGGDPLPGMIPNLGLLDLGKASFTGPKGTTSLPFNIASPWPASMIGSAISNNILKSTLVLDPGDYTVQTTGGNDVAAFTAPFSIPLPVTWTDRDKLTAIDRTKPLTISWSGGDAGQVVAVIGFSDDLPTNSSAAFACIAPLGANSFTVPVDMLANLPPSRANPLKSKQVIYLVDVPGASVGVIDPATGIGQGLTGAIRINGKTVAFQ